MDRRSGIVPDFIVVFDPLAARSTYNDYEVRGLAGVDRLSIVLDGGQASQFEGIVLVVLAFDIPPSPNFLERSADQRRQPQFSAQVIDPTAAATGFHHHQVNGVF